MRAISAALVSVEGIGGPDRTSSPRDAILNNEREGAEAVRASFGRNFQLRCSSPTIRLVRGGLRSPTGRLVAAPEALFHQGDRASPVPVAQHRFFRGLRRGCWTC